MGKGYVLYNTDAGQGQVEEYLDALTLIWDEELVFTDIETVTDYRRFVKNLAEDDFLIIAGGDGTLNRFVNDQDKLDTDNEIFYFPTGTGNDFARDMGKSGFSNPFPIGQYLRDLPTVEVKGKRYRFLNGVGFGLDGYCCEVGDQLRRVPGKKVNYTAIAVRGLLYDYIPTGAAVTVDGVHREYKKVWIAPTMFGKYYGGGMMAAPKQNRCADDGKLSLMVFHSAGKLKTLTVFPSIFTGKHIKHKDMVDVLTGHEITVEFNAPRSLQIDGETILNVRSYTARSGINGKTEVNNNERKTDCMLVE